MMRIIYFLMCIFLFSGFSHAQELIYDTTQEYIYARFNKEKAIFSDNRNVMKLTCVHDNNSIYEYQLHIGYNSAQKEIISKGKPIIFKLYNGEYMTLRSENDIQHNSFTAYKEQVKIRYKTFFIYRLTPDELNTLLKYQVFEFKQYINDGVFVRCGIRNIALWEFNEVLLKQFNELIDHISPYSVKKNINNKQKTNSNKKEHKVIPTHTVDRLYKEGRISYLIGDSLVKTDERINFDIKWIDYD